VVAGADPGAGRTRRAQALVAQEGGNFKLAPWDWRFYAEKLRKQLFDFDEAALKPYLQLGKSHRRRLLHCGKTVRPVVPPCSDIPVYHPDVRVWEVSGRQGAGPVLWRLFRADGQAGRRLDEQPARPAAAVGEVLPIILNNCNSRAPNPACWGSRMR